ncbi:hypothetical protein TNCV_3713871 [Trichonephila clavipes]|nr:hypothetical protein TNCV_3713871 [Trichonephila clavipes]
MYGSTCADMQVDVMGECLSSIKHVVGTAIRWFSSGRAPGTTPADDRYIVLQARRNRRQTAEKSAHTTQATDDRYRVLPWPEDCTVVICLHDALYGVYLYRLSIGEGVFWGAGNTGIGETLTNQMRAQF